jgi:hypothetical protein
MGPVVLSHYSCLVETILSGSNEQHRASQNGFDKRSAAREYGIYKDRNPRPYMAGFSKSIAVDFGSDSSNDSLLVTRFNTGENYEYVADFFTISFDVGRLGNCSGIRDGYGC